MPLKITDGSGKKIGSKTVGDLLKEALTLHAGNSTLGGQLLNPILTGNYEVVIKGEGATATLGTKVNINISEVGIDKAKKVDDLKEFVESTIFELTNAKNASAFKLLEDNLVKGTLPIMSYGQQKADCEAEASWNVAKILTEHVGYTPSEWGQKHVDKVAGKTLNAYKPIFAKFPHSTSGTPEQKLLTPQFYAYNAGVTLGGRSKAIDACFNKLTIMSKGKELQIYVQNLVGLSSQGNKQNKFNNPVWCAMYYQVIMKMILKAKDKVREKGKEPIFVSVELKAGVPEDWKFTKEMKAAAPDADDALETIFENLLRDEKNHATLTQK